MKPKPYHVFGGLPFRALSFCCGNAIPNQCWCGENSMYANLGFRVGGCTERCNGDPSQTCGGNYKLSVFEYEEGGLLVADRGNSYFYLFNTPVVAVLLFTQFIRGPNTAIGNIHASFMHACCWLDESQIITRAMGFPYSSRHSDYPCLSAYYLQTCSSPVFVLPLLFTLVAPANRAEQVFLLHRGP